MLWRTTYQTQCVLDQSIEWHRDGVFLFAPGPHVHAELGVWMRLLEAEYSHIDLYRVVWPNISQSVVDEMFPSSILRKMEYVESWPALDTDRLVAAVIRSSRAVVLMSGPATEEAWDEFRSAIARSGLNPATQ